MITKPSAIEHTMVRALFVILVVDITVLDMLAVVIIVIHMLSSIFIELCNSSLTMP